jgi:putative tricarboxylic transport membrane protein
VPQRLRALAPYVVVFALAAYFLHVASHFTFTPRGGRLGPDVWPRTILVLTMLVCALRIAFGLRTPRGDAAAGVDGGLLADVAKDAGHASDAATEAPAERYPARLAIGIALTVAYVATLGITGFAVGTFIYMLAMTVVGRYRRYGVATIVSLAGTLVLMFVFMKVVYLSLPLGVAPFESVSLTLMRLMGVR